MLNVPPGALVTPEPYHGAVVSLYADLDLAREVCVLGCDDVMLVLATGDWYGRRQQPHVLVITSDGAMGWCWIAEIRRLDDPTAEVQAGDGPW